LYGEMAETHASTTSLMDKISQISDTAMWSDDLQEECNIWERLVSMMTPHLPETNLKLRSVRTHCLNSHLLSVNLVAAANHARMVSCVNAELYKTFHPRVAVDYLTLSELLLSLAECSNDEEEMKSLFKEAKDAIEFATAIVENILGDSLLQRCAELRERSSNVFAMSVTQSST